MSRDDARQSDLAQIAVYTVQPRRSWSILDAKTGMEIALVTGKRRRDALLKHLRESGPGTWQELRERATAWKALHPKGGERQDGRAVNQDGSILRLKNRVTAIPPRFRK